MEGDSRMVVDYWGSLLQCKPVITSDSKYLLAALGSTIKVLNTSTGNLISTLKGHNSDVIGLSVVKGYKQKIVSCDEAGTLCLWDLEQSQKSAKLENQCSLELADKRKNFKISGFISKGDIEHVIVGVQLDKRELGTLKVFSNPFNSESSAPTFTEKDVKIKQGMFATSEKEDFMVWATSQHIVVKKLGATVEKRHGMGSREITCIACHPSQMVIATGDCSGRIVVRYNVFSNAVENELHWHSLPVSDLVFSSTGAELYSGGTECVLVKWQLVENKKYFLPRIGMPIKYVIADMMSSMLICAHVDSAFTVVSVADMKLMGTIQGVSFSINNANPCPAGIIHDPRTKAIVLNGKSGHVQFYDLAHNKLLYQLDIVRKNFINPERSQKMCNVEVEKIAMSPNGSWLATAEFRDDLESTREIRLKFWNYVEEKQSWVLNTGIEMPHDQYINGLMFDPSSESDNLAVCVTCSDDGKLKVWEVVDNSDIYKKNNTWHCRKIAIYRHLPCTTVTISPDGSLIAAGFTNVLTLWTTNECHLKGTLSQPFLKEDLRQIEFGRTVSCVSMVVSRSDNWLCGWDLFTCSLSWRVMVNSTRLVVDPFSSYMVLFSSNCDAFIFEPKNSLVSTRLECITSKPVMAAIFIPRQEKPSRCLPWNEQSQLFIIDQGQRLKLIEPMEDIYAAEAAINGVVQQLVQDTMNLPAPTPFAALVAKTRASDVVQEVGHQVGSGGFGVKVERSSALLEQVLNEARVYRLDSFTALADAFYKLVIPDAKTSEEVMDGVELKTLLKEKKFQPEENEASSSTQVKQDRNKQTDEAKAQRSERKRKKKKGIERGLNSDFSGLKGMLRH